MEHTQNSRVNPMTLTLNLGTGLIFGRFYSHYLVIFPTQKNVSFSQFLEENSQFQVGKKLIKE